MHIILFFKYIKFGALPEKSKRSSRLHKFWKNCRLKIFPLFSPSNVPLGIKNFILDENNFFSKLRNCWKILPRFWQIFLSTVRNEKFLHFLKSFWQIYFSFAPLLFEKTPNSTHLRTYSAWKFHQNWIIRLQFFHFKPFFWHLSDKNVITKC